MGLAASLTTATTTVTAAIGMGSLTAVSSSSSCLTAAGPPTLGIPTPSLTGVLTGIKPPPLFSLPGARAHQMHQDRAEEEKPVSYVLGG